MRPSPRLPRQTGHDAHRQRATGVVESGVFPACFYLIAMWYKRSEAQKRYTFFFSSTTLAGGFGGLLASAIGKMDGMRGYRGWRWIFIIGACFSI